MPEKSTISPCGTAVKAGISRRTRRSAIHWAVVQVIAEALESRRLLSSIIVNTTDDTLDNPILPAHMTLRDAIAQANASTTAATITFDSTVFAAPQTIVLNGSDLELKNTTAPITINGPSAGVTVSGNNLSRVFLVDTGVTAAVSGISVMYGNASAGGGIENNGTLTLNDDQISDNTASGTNGGGGIYNTNALTIQNSTISSNSVTNSSYNAYGGGINSTGYLTITGSTVDANSVLAGGGGGVFSYELVITDSMVANNIADGENATGGGIYGVQLAMTNCSVINNSAGAGGGGVGDYVRSPLNVAPAVQIVNSTISGNTSGVGGVFGYGGGISLYGEGGAAFLTDVTISANTIATRSAPGGGGGLYFDGIVGKKGNVTLTNVTIFGNNEGPIGYGGGIYFNHRQSSVTLSLFDDTIAGNSAFITGGIFVRGTGTIANSVISGNVGASPSGPDVYGTITSQGHNLISQSTGTWTATDIVGTAANPINADLSPLTNNGGATETMLPQTGSPAIAAGSVSLVPFGLTTDQRGFNRTINGAVDIGAAEVGTPGSTQNADQTFTLKLDSTATNLQIFQNGSLIASESRQLFPFLVFNLSAGPGSLTIDGTYGNPILYASTTVAGGPNPAALNIISTTGANIFSVGSNQMNFDDAIINYAGVSSITYTSNISTEAITQTAQPANNATFTLAGATNLDSLTISGGIFTIPGDASGIYGINAYSLASLNVGSGAAVILAAPISESTNDRTILTTNALTVSGTLDITQNGIDVHYGTGTDPFSTIQTDINTGIITSSLDDTQHALGYADGKDGAVTGLSSGDILIRYTTIGDTNLDGTTNFSDLLTLAANYGRTGSWDTGDFNGDGTVNFSDLLSLAANYGASLSGPQAVPPANFSTLWSEAQTDIAKTSAGHLVIINAPTHLSANHKIHPAIEIAIEDIYGNIITTDDSDITISISIGPKGAHLSGTLTVKAVDGIATFTNLQVSKTGKYTFKAT